MKVKLENWGTVNKNSVILSKEKEKEWGPMKSSLVMVFSYETCVSFELRGCGDFVQMTRQNDWSVTTGKLLNELEPDKSKRVAGDVFEVALEKALSSFEQA